MQATIASIDTERIPFWSALFTDRRIAPALGLGFTSGMPFLLTYSTPRDTDVSGDVMRIAEFTAGRAFARPVGSTDPAG